MADDPLQAVVRRLRELSGRTGDCALDDAQLLRRFADGRDATAFEVLVWRHGPLVLATCRKILRREQDAEDAFQATFLTSACKAARSVAGHG